MIFNIVLKALPRAVRWESEIKEIGTVNKELNFSIIVDNKILYTGEPKLSMKKLLDLIGEFHRAARYKINEHKSVIVKHTKNSMAENELVNTAL